MEPSILPIIKNSELEPLLKKITTLSFTELPDFCEERDELVRFYTIDVTHRGHDRWSVKHLNSALDADLHDEYEPLPSNREEDFLNRYRFTLAEAVAIAEDAAQRVLFRGVSADDIRTHGSFQAAFAARQESGVKFEGHFRKRK